MINCEHCMGTMSQTGWPARLQLLYGLNDRPRRLLDGLPPPPHDWLAWAQQAIERAPQPSSLPLDPAEARALCACAGVSRCRSVRIRTM